MFIYANLHTSFDLPPWWTSLDMSLRGEEQIWCLNANTIGLNLVTPVYAIGLRLHGPMLI